MLPKKILIIDDNPLCQKLFHDLVILTGHQSQTCSTAEEGLIYLENNKFDLLLLDLQLPLMSGGELLKKITENKKLTELKVIIVSSFSESFLNNPLVKEYIQKPISVLDFMETLTKTLMGPSQCQLAS
ncbi:MAG: response regulator [Alphaproteobacteria bacterium]|nr:response regulator [Alphaproteobacteria bacterium]